MGDEGEGVERRGDTYSIGDHVGVGVGVRERREGGRWGGGVCGMR